MIKLTDEAPQGADLSGDQHRRLIGWIGLFLPLILIGLALERDGLKTWSRLESISAYYYSGAVTVFVGMLVSLALFLFTYRGYKNDYHKWDRTTAIIAGFAALIVALFPTAAPKHLPVLAWWRPWTGELHHAGAIVLFAMFAVFALWLFRIDKDGKPQMTRPRDRIYFACGLVIVGCILWAGYNGFRSAPIFWPEAIALIAFSISWLVKGYADEKVVSVARSMLRSGSKPPG